MSNKVKAPNQKSNGFLYGIIAVVVIMAVVIGYTAWSFAGTKLKYDHETIEATVAIEDSHIVLRSNKLKEDARTVEIFEDLMCGACATLNSSDHESLTEAINNGDLLVKYNMMTFQDHEEIGGSTRGLETLIQIAESGDASLFWTIHNALMENQSSTGFKWSDDDFNELLKQADFSGTPEVGNEALLRKAQDMAKANQDDIQKRIGRVSSPHVFVDGEEISTQNPADQSLNWVPLVLAGEEKPMPKQ